MVRLLTTVAVLGASTALAAPQAPTNTTTAQSASTSGLAPYTAPSQNRTITAWLSIGDSYAAGVGADQFSDIDSSSGACLRSHKATALQMETNSALPGTSSSRSLAFGACDGATIQDMLDNQLSQGAPAGGQYTPIGKPQVATLSVGIVDSGLPEVISNCILNVNSTGDCSSTISNTWTTLNDTSGDFLNALVGAYSQVVQQARLAGGVNPASSFQLFVNGYPRFWNADTDACTSQYWSYNNQQTFLTKELRATMNSMVDSLNTKIQNAVQQVANIGVFYVDSFQSQFDGHRYCENGAAVPDDASGNTWLFARNSPQTPAGPGGANDPNLNRLFFPKSVGYGAIATSNIAAITAAIAGTSTQSLNTVLMTNSSASATASTTATVLSNGTLSSSGTKPSSSSSVPVSAAAGLDASSTWAVALAVLFVGMVIGA